jgi:hypothetical protein
MKAFLTAAILLAAGVAHATTYTGTVQRVQAQASPTTSGNIRISVYTGSTTSCAGTGWYAFDLPSGGLGSVWDAIVIAAVTGATQVTIAGTGTCDAYAIEGVSYITALP